MNDIHFLSVERTMTRLRSTLVCTLALAAFGCHPDAVTNSPVIPSAAITWANLVSDTGQLDTRVVDMVSNAGLFNANFRDGLVFPQGIEAGQRHIKTFIHSTDPTIAQQFLVDTTYNLLAGEYYSFYLAGFARLGRTPVARAVILPGTPPTPAARQFMVRVLNLAPSFAGSIIALADTTAPPDVFFIKGTGLPSGAPQVASVGYTGATPYVALDTGRYRMIVTSAGTTAPVVVQAALPPGQAGNSTTNPIAGSLVPGTVLTAVIVPRSVPASAAPQTRPSLRATDTTVAEASRRITRSNDTVTVQVGSITILTNRSSSAADSTLRRTGTGASAGVAVGDVVLVTGAALPEYNGWQGVIAVADTLLCNPTNAGDTQTKCAAANDTATTRFRFRYRIAGTPVSPGSGTVVYRINAPAFAGVDFVTPQIVFIVDKRPPFTAP